MSGGELEEAAALRRDAAEWLGTLRTAGVPTRAVAAAVITALTEFAIVEVGPEAAAAWLRSHADAVDRLGGEWRKALPT